MLFSRRMRRRTGLLALTTSMLMFMLILILMIMVMVTVPGGGHGGRTNKQIANSGFEKVINALENQDKKALEDLFSKKSIADSSNFYENLDALFDYYEGVKIAYNDWRATNANSEENAEDHTQKWKSIQSTYDVETDKGTYRFAIQTFIVDSSDPNNIGIYSLYITKAEESDMQFAYWGDGKWEPGITIGE